MAKHQKPTPAKRKPNPSKMKQLKLSFPRKPRQPSPITCTRVHVSRDGYSRGGKYYGVGGMPVYECEFDDGSKSPQWVAIRAHNAKDAKERFARLRARYPHQSGQLPNWDNGALRKSNPASQIRVPKTPKYITMTSVAKPSKRKPAWERKPNPHGDDDFELRKIAGFRTPGGKSALRKGKQMFACPTCKRPDVLSARDKSLGYQCDRCADRDEGGMWSY